MANSPRVSVVMTAYNVAEYIGPAIVSVLAQTFSDFELLIIDDGSTDDTVRIAEGFQDARVRVVRSVHLGPAPTLKAGIELTTANYIGLLDADDLWSPKKLQHHVEFLDAHPGADLTFSWSRIIDRDGQDTGLTSRLWGGPISFSELLADNVIGNGSALVFRRAALEDAGGIDTSFRACHDLDAWLRIGALRPGNLWAIPEFLTYYRRRPGQLTEDVDLVMQGFEQLLRKAGWFAPRAVAAVEHQARSNMQRFSAYGWYQAGAHGRALSTMANSLRRAPRLFFADRRNWEMTAAAFSAMLLPPRLHRRITGMALRAKRA